MTYEEKKTELLRLYVESYYAWQEWERRCRYARDDREKERLREVYADPARCEHERIIRELDGLLYAHAEALASQEEQRVPD